MSKSFKDSQGREWIPRIDGEVVFEYEVRSGVQLFKAMLEKSVAGAIPGAKELMILLWLSVQDRAKELGVDEITFRKSLHGPMMQQCLEALAEALFDFFPALRSMAEALKAQTILKQAGSPGTEPTSTS